MEVWVDGGDEEAKASAAGGGGTRRRNGGTRAPSHPSSSSKLGADVLRREVPSSFLDNNKENVDPRHCTFGRSAPRSPIPSWYPRLPLQDVTLLLNAFQGMQVYDDEKVKSQFQSCSGSAASGSAMAPSISRCRANAARMSMTNGCMPLSTSTATTAFQEKAQSAASLRKHYR